MEAERRDDRIVELCRMEEEPAAAGAADQDVSDFAFALRHRLHQLTF